MSIIIDISRLDKVYAESYWMNPLQVDVELRKSMWDQVRELRQAGVTIILTTHYIDEAEQMADRVGVIFGGQLILIEETKTLMKQLGQKELILELKEPLDRIPDRL